MPTSPPPAPTAPRCATLRFEEAGPVATVTLLREHIDTQLLRDLAAVCDHLEDHSPTRVVVFRGQDGVFCRGIEFGDFRPDAPMDIHGFHKWEKLCLRIERLQKVTIAVLEGPVIGGGVQLALAVDARVMAPDSSLQLPEVQQGFLPGMATWRLPRFVGMGQARRIVLRCPVIPAQEALSLGLVDQVSPDLDAAVAALVEEFGPAHVVAVTLARRLLLEAAENSFEDALGHFLAAQHRAISQPAFLDTVQEAADTRGREG